jgi:hypothetical protein
VQLYQIYFQLDAKLEPKKDVFKLQFDDKDRWSKIKTKIKVELELKPKKTIQLSNFLISSLMSLHGTEGS